MQKQISNSDTTDTTTSELNVRNTASDQSDYHKTPWFDKVQTEHRIQGGDTYLETKIEPSYELSRIGFIVVAILGLLSFVFYAFGIQGIASIFAVGMIMFLVGFDWLSKAYCRFRYDI